jgi:Tannase-like family of unknown function (DUF6351)
MTDMNPFPRPTPALFRAAQAGLITVAVVALAACASLFPRQEDLKLTVVSSPKAEWVSGDSALVKIMGDVQPIGRLRVVLNGRDVTPAFARASDGKLTALLSGLQLGKNALVADLQLPGDSFMAATSTLEITNYPRSGPMFSGPQQQPFTCQTDTFLLPASKATLGAPLDGDCAIATRVDYVYRNTAAKPDFVPLPSLKDLPADVASTTTLDGKTVPYIVRVETGTLNRAIYQTSVLHDPTKEATPSYTAPPTGWNGRLVYTFGGGCTGGWYRQGNITGGVLDHNILKYGYAMASSSLNVFGVNCQDLTAAESMAMVKEQFIKTYGAPRYTIGWGCSGGSYQQHQIADNYPGLLDGILPGCSFPEVGFATVQSITDHRLLGNYFKNKVPGTYSDEQQRQVAGVHSAKVIYATTVYEGAMRIAPDVFCPATLPAEKRYNAATNPKGVRCSIYDHNINVYGKDPVTGFARRPIDNVGVQYGLRALNDGVISVDQFLDINAAAGGFDQDGKFSATRTVGDAQAMRASYQTGRLTSGGGGLKDIPIIDYRAYSDDNPVGDIHLRYHSFSMRERLIKANGHADNQVMLVEDFRYGYYSSDSPLLMSALAEMDNWLANIAADIKPGSQRDKVIRNKPATLQEGCLTRDAAPAKIAEKFERTSGKCAGIYPAPASPRFVAGGPITADVIKCQLKPVSKGDYSSAFTPEQQTRLEALFPQGVCDWSRPGVEQQGLRGTWLSF